MKNIERWTIVGFIIAFIVSNSVQISYAQTTYTKPLKNGTTDKCMSVYAASRGNGADIIQWKCTGSLEQTFLLEPDGRRIDPNDPHSKPTYRMKSFKGQIGKCLDIAGNSKDIGARLIQWDCLGTDNQRWVTYNPQSGGQGVLIEAVHSGLCLQPSQGSSSDGIRIVQVPCNRWWDDLSLLWYFY